MAQGIRTVMVLGATGNLGPHILNALSTAGFHVKALSRSQPRASSTVLANVDVLRSDYSFASLADVFKGQDAVVSTISTLSVQQQLAIIDAATTAGVKRFLPSEFGSDTSVDDEENTAAFIRDKQEVVRYLRRKEAGGLSWTALCPGPWVDWMLEEGNGLLGIDVRSRTATIIDSGEQEFTASTIELVARATASVLLHPDETKNRYIQVHSFTLTQNLLLGALERAIGAEFSRKQLTREELLALAKKDHDGGGEEAGHYHLVTATVYSGSRLTWFPDRAIDGNKILELTEEEDLDDTVERVLTKIQTS
ncbi:hypothetical protein F4777DRAFT_596737 [Nemania sp. FL0916]|nr:hypothetical protein F4777DRAFT_596737 [Nemania sp. FL0916]